MIRLALCIIVLLTMIGCVTCEGGTEVSIQQKYDQMLLPSVYVETDRGSGSGVAVDSYGGFTIILTAKHVIKKSKEVWVRFYDGEYDYPATVLKVSEDHDLALLMVQHRHKHIAKWADPLELYVFEEVFKIGHALGANEPLVTEGVISAVEDYYFITSSPIVFGDSGGGIFWFDGDDFILIGITTALEAVPLKFGAVPVYHIGYAVDMEAAHELFAQED